MSACDSVSCAYTLESIEAAERPGMARTARLLCTHCGDRLNRLTMRTDDEIQAELDEQQGGS